ncbi:hypothetical protein BCR42DRAFT_415426 [Absidia repens]|uniref:tRNA (guanosine(18)-2'-O)-methyltransferase TARBP1 n=1 Tax=Absidia repens TaxID=90262 RepID=A0A1X2IHU5_9FUNG|nr:hypothetical protein BCR42DRAFT_415426 [Absidia repens]
MDFASAPLQSLLYRNADASQLKAYIEELYAEFGNTVDEKDRFGTVQLFLPVLGAHLDQITDQHEKERCLDSILRPLTLSTLAHDSMISTESLTLVSKTAAHFAILSLLSTTGMTSTREQVHNDDDDDDDDNETPQQKQGDESEDVAEDTFTQTTTLDKLQESDGFGYALLRTLVGQFALVMDIEPDFVDLQPIKFITDNIKDKEGDAQTVWNDIQTHVNKLKQSCQRRYKSRISMLQDEDELGDGSNNNNNSIDDDDDDDDNSIISGMSFNTTTTIGTKMTLSDFTAMGLLDLECCVDLLIQFAQEAIVYQQHQANVNDDDTVLHYWMDLLTVISVAMLPCTQQAIRSKLTNDFIPTLLSWKRNTGTNEKEVTMVCRILWQRTLQIFGLPATNLLRSETYGLIAKFFDAYFGLDPISAQVDFTIAPLDLRCNEDFFVIIQSGLRSDDALARKYTIFILKRLIDFSQKYQCLPTTSQSANQQQLSWTKYFEWSAVRSDEYTDLWDDWFLLYDTMHESMVHLVEPVLNRFESLLGSTQVRLDTSWWILLLYRGFNNEIRSIQMVIWEYIFARQNSNTLDQLASQSDFFFGAFLKSIDNTSIFSVSTQGTMVSPFGEHLKSFMARIISNFTSMDDKKRFLKQLIHHLAHVVNSHVLILYIMESLAEANSTPCWSSEELKSLRYLVDRHRHFNVKNRKQFLKKLGISCLVRFGDPATITFSDMAKTISSLVTDYPFLSTSDEYQSLKSWLEQKVTKKKFLQDIIENLKKRVDTYVCEEMSQGNAPVEILQNQANVLANMSLLLVENGDGNPDPNKIHSIFAAMSVKLQDQTSSLTTFNRLLVLLDSLWKRIETCFGPITDIVLLMNWKEPLYQLVLKRIENQIINTDSTNATAEPLVDLLLSVMQRILADTHVYESDDESKMDLLVSYAKRTLDLLHVKDKELGSLSELSKLTLVRVLGTVYQLAYQNKLYGLKIDGTTISLISTIIIKRTPDLTRYRSWGDTMATFTRHKWRCLGNIVQYGKWSLEHEPESEIFDPAKLFALAMDQLESASDICAETIIDCITILLSMSWEKQPDSVLTCVDYVISILRDYLNSSKAFGILIRSLINLVLQPCLLSNTNLNQDGGPLKKAIRTIIEFGEWKPLLVGEAALLLHDFWSAFTPETNESMLLYVKEIATLLVFGPLRDRDDQKLEAAALLKLQYADVLKSAEGTAEMVFNQNDYYVRVLMSDLILRLDESNDRHSEFAHQLMNHMMESNNKPELYEGVFTNTAMHRFKIRSWCTILLTSRFIKVKDSHDYVDRMLGLMQKETSVSVRSYMEWTVTRLLLQFPEQLELIYQQLEMADLKPSYVVSILTVTFFLGEKLSNQDACDYFKKIFPLLAPWMIPNHFNIRMYALCSWERNWNAYMKSGLDLNLENNPYALMMSSFMKRHGDCKKVTEKIKSQYFLTTFDPIEDYNIEYIFRENLHVFGVAENERIGSKSFIRINSSPVPGCPFSNANRDFLYSGTDPTELTDNGENRFTEKDQNIDADIDESYQKKITPWEMMLETDVDLTKSLVKKKRRRNEIIVVASLVDRLPNLAGLCRTCEIFNASLLVVHSLKIKDDPSFTTVSVSSEKWMPMVEVPAPDLTNYLRKKKDEGYTLCGLEQTTNSVKLGDFDFPEKCVLLLGKERQGIPANLLQLLDYAVEIPQYGVIRSLNVHVSGSIILYEYTKQIHWRQQQLMTQ